MASQLKVRICLDEEKIESGDSLLGGESMRNLKVNDFLGGESPLYTFGAILMRNCREVPFFLGKDILLLG